MRTPRAVVVLVALAACQLYERPAATDTPDAATAHDATPDATPDATADAPPDAAIDAPPDAPPADAPTDAPLLCDPATAPPPSCGDGSATKHDTQATARVLDTVYNGVPTAVTGTLDTTNSVDWYTYAADGGFWNGVDPQVALKAWTISRVCVYAACDWPASDCPADSVYDVAPGGQGGCCATEVPAFQVYGCGEVTTQVWMSVQSKEPSMCATCIPYELDYNW